MGNLTRHPVSDLLDPRMTGDLWGQVFEWAPSLDLIAAQDSMGAQGNSFRNVSDFLGNVSAASVRQQRAIWSNVEVGEETSYSVIITIS